MANITIMEKLNEPNLNNSDTKILENVDSQNIANLYNIGVSVFRYDCNESGWNYIYPKTSLKGIGYILITKRTIIMI